MGRHVQESSSKTVISNSQELVRMGYTYATSITMTTLEIAHLVIKYSSCPCFHQQTIAFMGLIELICLLNNCRTEFITSEAQLLENVGMNFRC
jgi:hypothetical protein